MKLLYTKDLSTKTEAFGDSRPPPPIPYAPLLP